MIKMRNTREMIQGLKAMCIYLNSKIDYLPEIVEVGCFAGEGTKLLAPFTSKIYCVDPWTAGYDPRDPASDQDRLDEAEREFDKAIAKIPHVVKIKKPSLEAVSDFVEKKVDWVYIDGNHRYDNVMLDIRAWMPVCKLAICGHDYFKHGLSKGVPRALDDLFGGPDETFEDGSWIKFLGEGKK